MNNVYDDGVEFQPIHRVVFNTQPEKLLQFLQEHVQVPNGRKLSWIAGAARGEMAVCGDSLGALIDAFQQALDLYLSENPGCVDYIHDESAVLDLSLIHI